MKANLSILCLASLLLVACGGKCENGADGRGTCGGVMLATELPPELLEGTQFPVILPLFTPMSGTRP